MNIVDILFPKKCVSCGRVGDYICRECEVGMWEEEQICPSCGRKSPGGERHVWCREAGLDGVVCIYAFEGLARKIIEKAKYKGQFDLLGRLIPKAEEIRQREDLAKLVELAQTDKPIMVPVPLWPKKERERGFNQSGIISSALGASMGLRTENLLIRTRDTKQQVGRTRKERLEAMKGAFRLNSKFKLANSQIRSVLLVDDVWTTGATLRECGRVLKKAGAEKVWGWVLAR